MSRKRGGVEKQIDFIGQHKIFISYASEDERIAKFIYLSLSSYGLEPWWDKEYLNVGDDWEEKIEKGIGESDFAAIAFSKNLKDKKKVL